MNAKLVYMLAGLYVAIGVVACKPKTGSVPDTPKQQCMRVQNDFEVIRLIGSGHGKMALSTFNRLAKQDATGDRIVLSAFASGNTNRVRATLSMMLDAWIISEACHSQHPPLTVLLDNPERLGFLARLGAYREEHPNQSFDAQVDKTVAEILLEARRRLAKNSTD
jgi:hypothetical protein